MSALQRLKNTSHYSSHAFIPHLTWLLATEQDPMLLSANDKTSHQFLIQMAQSSAEEELFWDKDVLVC